MYRLALFTGLRSALAPWFGPWRGKLETRSFEHEVIAGSEDDVLVDEALVGQEAAAVVMADDDRW